MKPKTTACPAARPGKSLLRILFFVLNCVSPVSDMSLRGSETDEAIPALQAGDCVASLAMTPPVTYSLTTTTTSILASGQANVKCNSYSGSARQAIHCPPCQAVVYLPPIGSNSAKGRHVGLPPGPTRRGWLRKRRKCRGRTCVFALRQAQRCFLLRVPCLVTEHATRITSDR